MVGFLVQTIWAIEKFIRWNNEGRMDPPGRVAEGKLAATRGRKATIPPPVLGSADGGPVTRWMPLQPRPVAGHIGGGMSGCRTVMDRGQPVFYFPERHSRCDQTAGFNCSTHHALRMPTNHCLYKRIHTIKGQRRRATR